MKKHVLVLGNPAKPGVKEAVGVVVGVLAEKADVTSRIDLELQESLEDTGADVAIVLGGDGTILRVARLMGRRQTPVVGVNFGKFGFLAALDLQQLLERLDELVEGSLPVRERTMLAYSVRSRGQELRSGVALNDVLIAAPSIGRMIATRMHVAGELVATYNGDGVIVSTPTGSTGHSLSAGGPVVDPDMDAVVVCPICTHALAVRPLVVSPAKALEFEVADGREAKVLADGQEEIPLAPELRTVVKRADVRFKLVDAGVRSFYDTLKTKLDWKGQPNYGVG